MARSRQHRMLLAVYGGIGLAIGLAYARSVVYGEVPWDQPSVQLLVGSFVLLFFSAIGTRAVFALPMALRANWIFRITSVHSPTTYFKAVHKAMLLLACGPVWIASAIFYLAVWRIAPVIQHMAIMMATGAMLVYLLMFRFRKLPFACSYQPGKTIFESSSARAPSFFCSSRTSERFWNSARCSARNYMRSYWPRSWASPSGRDAALWSSLNRATFRCNSKSFPPTKSPSSTSRRWRTHRQRTLRGRIAAISPRRRAASA
jgi:hypothetical protein